MEGKLSYLHTSYHLESNYSARQVSLVAAITWFHFFTLSCYNMTPHVQHKLGW